VPLGGNFRGITSAGFRLSIVVILVIKVFLMCVLATYVM